MGPKTEALHHLTFSGAKRNLLVQSKRAPLRQIARHPSLHPEMLSPQKGPPFTAYTLKRNNKAGWAGKIPVGGRGPYGS